MSEGGDWLEENGISPLCLVFRAREGRVFAALVVLLPWCVASVLCWTRP